MSQQPATPMFINIPPTPSNPDTPSDMPGTPNSSTTSMSALSTTAIKDGHRGHAHLALGGPRGHAHHPSTNSLDAERADRISRLAGLERVSTLRATNQQQSGNSASPQTTPTSTGLPPHNLPTNLTPAYFDQNGQPTAITKMSTVGTASATGSVGARTTTEAGEQFEMDAEMTEVDEDGMSMDTNYRTMDVDSTSGAMDDEMASRSVGGFEDRMSDDGTASLVGFGEGANSTVSGPIYQRRPLPGTAGASGVWGLERSSSGLSQDATMRNREMRDPTGNDTPHSSTAAAERRTAKYLDGIADGGGRVSTTDDDMFVDTTSRGPVPVQPGQPQTSDLREGVGGPASRQAAERIVRERLDSGEGQSPILSVPKTHDNLGKFYFEDKI
ncbi:Uu.00g138940.m01.CDS01 [Anthostomella pinea]|uniref:Uu.00g138940.m01.CDS01 n=1 Tax=Anthostomella pinea TaxID=933095 RepID=A0AAI8YL44_9PEZI|nr:Uu.00g138940.m01.CDS01 [Anthostomella pinea]